MRLPSWNTLRGDRPLSDIPNQSGFKFLGMLESGKEVECEVVCVGGLHSLKDGMFPKIRSWRSLPAN